MKIIFNNAIGNIENSKRQQQSRTIVPGSRMIYIWYCDSAPFDEKYLVLRILLLGSTNSAGFSKKKGIFIPITVVTSTL